MLGRVAFYQYVNIKFSREAQIPARIGLNLLKKGSLYYTLHWTERKSVGCSTPYPGPWALLDRGPSLMYEHGIWTLMLSSSRTGMQYYNLSAGWFQQWRGSWQHSSRFWLQTLLFYTRYRMLVLGNNSLVGTLNVSSKIQLFGRMATPSVESSRHSSWLRLRLWLQTRLLHVLCSSMHTLRLNSLHPSLWTSW